MLPTLDLTTAPESPRRVLDFCADWRFHRGEAAGGENPARDDSAWEPVALPHCFNADDTFLPKRGYYRGPGWYRKRFALPAPPAGRVFLRLEGAYTQPEAWVNGRAVARWPDGYTPVCPDITQALQVGENLVAVRVDNSHHPDLLPGRPDPDYNVYGGIYREVTLVATGTPSVAALRVTTPQVTGEQAHVKAQVALQGEAVMVAVTGTIHDPQGREAGKATAAAVADSVVLDFPPLADPELWSPDHPALYRLVVEVAAAGKPTDRVEERFGLRWFEFTVDEGLSLNGERLWLHGVNRHQDFPGLGYALPASLQRQDAELIRAVGGNFVRCSHYPQHPAFLQACDELGILVYEEPCSWQFIGGPVFQDNAEICLRAMIERDANHPSLLLWGLFNEGRNREFFARLHAAAHEVDPTRPTVYAENNPEKGLELGSAWVPDVLGINYEVERIDEVRGKLPGRPLLSSEHANATTHHPEDPADLARQVDRINGELDILEARPWLAGTTLWSLHDYGTDYEPSWPIQLSGVVDSWRRAKESYHLLRARWAAERVVHIEGHWQSGAPTRAVRVITNCESVSLRLNGRELGAREQGYVRTWEVAYEPGTLEAVGTKGGQQVTDALRTHGEPRGLQLAASATNLSGPGDACLLTATVLDGQGAPVLAEECRVVFHAEGPLALRGAGGKPEAQSWRGEAVMAVQATGAGTGRMWAEVEGVRSEAVEIGVGRGPVRAGRAVFSQAEDQQGQADHQAHGCRVDLDQHRVPGGAGQQRQHPVPILGD